jgi:hypothetical protein
MSPRKAEQRKTVGNWSGDPLARMLFVNGPPPQARDGGQPPIPFATLDEMRAAWIEVREQLLPVLTRDGKVPWAERQWGDGS